ncbi:DUF4097 family beta strand repeat-containing protein [Microbacterium sp.]|uniref:DUF4097 family beta strand repeat-containing protein n=1 Tax=Microbacterium sp. TaxID=51671 RepID=UPI003A941176
MSTPTTTGETPAGATPAGATPPYGPPPVRPTPPGGPGPRAGSGRVVAILAIVFGAILVLGTLGSAVAGTIRSASVHTTSRTIDVTGVDVLKTQLNAGSLRVEFADVTEAQLTVDSSSSADQWTVRRDGGELEVSSPNHPFRWWGGGFFQDGAGNAVLRLPQSLAGLDASLDLAAGDLTVDGDFGDLELTAGAGRLRAQGSARTLSTELNAGRADLQFADVDTADLQVNAGSLDATITGAQPSRLTLSASAGSMDVTVPAGSYDVTSDTSAGSFDNRLGSSPDASSTVRVDVSAGRIVLQPSR